ncbi:hypothetical protein BOTBODRAFT_40075 [Botryobasidium botryosum FD-172 SS1]|uniref:Uncharacterized protein n=1 Tax=Botryobasidium botryosum (strain FD-172 SS1) TaxID=930990 RepID=A0A067MZK6_BOTB1|nr:hypothetical protein BOTBODRAFT_40075 [Botryobasidium botryosum FD-172 SS1]
MSLDLATVRPLHVHQTSPYHPYHTNKSADSKAPPTLQQKQLVFGYAVTLAQVRDYAKKRKLDVREVKCGDRMFIHADSLFYVVQHMACCTRRKACVPIHVEVPEEEIEAEAAADPEGPRVTRRWCIAFGNNFSEMGWKIAKNAGLWEPKVRPFQSQSDKE